MKRWRKRRHVGGSEPAPLTPAQVQVLRDREDAVGRIAVRTLVVAFFATAVWHVAFFASVDAQAHRTIMLLSIVNAVVLVVAFLLILAGHELAGVVVALVASSLHILWVCVAISAGVSVESLLFAIAIAPFVMVRRELPALRIALSTFVLGIYLVCEFAFPDGSGLHQLEADVATAFARSNRVAAAAGILAIVAVMQANMAATRRILEGAARYGELRATTDELTGVYNRRPVIAQLSEWAERGRGNYAIVIIDLDGFKTINDEFGHDCGDTMLQTVALTLRRHFRPVDMVSRWGGDEFLVLMPGVRHSEVMPVLERLRHAIGLIEESCGDHVHRVTVSIGASMGARGQTPDECISAADRALYRAKRRGRDQVVVAGVTEPKRALRRPTSD